MMVTKGPKHVASHTIKCDVFDVSCFIILIIRNSKWCLEGDSNLINFVLSQ